MLRNGRKRHESSAMTVLMERSDHEHAVQLLWDEEMTEKMVAKVRITLYGRGTYVLPVFEGENPLDAYYHPFAVMSEENGFWTPAPEAGPFVLEEEVR